MQLGAAPNLGDYIPQIAPLDLQGLTKKMKKVGKVFDDFFEKIIDEHVKCKDEDKNKDFVHVMSGFLGSEESEYCIERLHPPAPLLVPHASTEECTINGFHIPKKAHIIINAWAIGRDPDAWTDAEKFFPERFVGSNIDVRGRDFQLIPFGSGRTTGFDCCSVGFGSGGALFRLGTSERYVTVGFGHDRGVWFDGFKG
ncbi:hypothetical protein FEM48_Zijuj08G0171000 [Ziziphus jujuba var. spinosa]|uniref:Cytochrome P450 71A1-like n=1 Tax=Ziziphus jujuba var. spinosa TaxID=714518 RepID=A0A978V0B5_ZIZJJ|nr:hypothetical protein FEM48_Zijuj08G0171000 [Ziziphus jujuba var. spinosa]